LSALQLAVHEDRLHLGRVAARQAADALVKACHDNGSATLVVATGTSQFEVLAELALAEDVPWDAVRIFHLDEYVGLSADHPASFRRFLWDRFIDKLPRAPNAFHEIDGQATDPASECRRLAMLVPATPFDVALIGIGENGHLAFNDPPADFTTVDPYIVVQLDERCRRQQVGEGWFRDLSSVPKEAISMSVNRIMASRLLICSVPDRRKADALKATVEGPVTPDVPASILQEHYNCRLHVDRAATALLRQCDTLSK
jgi:glucosamine-6-phosphate deaminase